MHKVVETEKGRFSIKPKAKTGHYNFLDKNEAQLCCDWLNKMMDKQMTFDQYKIYVQQDQIESTNNVLEEKPITISSALDEIFKEIDALEKEAKEIHDHNTLEDLLLAKEHIKIVDDKNEQSILKFLKNMVKNVKNNLFKEKGKELRVYRNESGEVECVIFEKQGNMIMFTNTKEGLNHRIISQISFIEPAVMQKMFKQAFAIFRDDKQKTEKKKDKPIQLTLF
jgi:hypothetical protein